MPDQLTRQPGRILLGFQHDQGKWSGGAELLTAFGRSSCGCWRRAGDIEPSGQAGSSCPWNVTLRSAKSDTVVPVKAPPRGENSPSFTAPSPLIRCWPRSLRVTAV